ncbi:hypothetical protein [Ekhidna sp.]|jgi:hypothetical protein|uniref:hypothetical protein n=1 Tax=Ekhidna sp. TaxID=2608089 RepID=UPI003C7ECD9F
MNNQNLLCTTAEALELTIMTTIKQMKDICNSDQDDVWISKDEANQLLRRTSDSLINKLRKEKQILTYQEDGGRFILISKPSLLDYIKRTAK